MSNTNALTGLEIAVIGMAGRFPGAKTIPEFWDNLKNSVESIAFFSDDELKENGHDSSTLQNPNYIKAHGMLAGIEYFDSTFFDYIPQEADIMDPQMRLFHEGVWSALEDAGYDPDSYKGLIGLYGGATHNFNWEALTLVTGKSLKMGQFAALHLVEKDFLCTRVSYKLNLRGPSFTLYTGCSTSLVAIHLACQATLNGECDIALAGGVTVTRTNPFGYWYQEGMIYSQDGHCRAFDAKCSGIVGGDGLGIVVLKRLAEAVADGDHIYALVKGSAINNDGNKKVGYTAPSVEGQAKAIRTAHITAEVEPGTITYVETHGTATELGDPVEIEALKLAFDSNKKKFCGLGSAKSNVGHLDSAAGVTGFIKTVLALKHRLIPPSLYFETPNPKLGLEDSPFYVVNRLQEWKSNGYPRRAGVSSFGIGGTNAHIILEEFIEGTGGLAPLPGEEVPEGTRGLAPLPIETPSRQYQIILLSAKTPSALERMTANLAGFFKENPGIHLADAAYTLQVGRGAFNHRRMLVGANIEEAAAALSSPAGENLHTNSLKVEKRPVVFMFSGQGSEYVNMGLELYREEKAFKEEIDRCFDLLEHMGYHIKDILYPRGNVEEAEEKINKIVYSFPIKFAVEYTAARLLIKWGIKPYAMIGPSFGEYIAACLSGVFTLEDALFIVAARGKLIDSLPKGAMLNVPLSEDQLKPLLNQDIELASVNGPAHCIVSGTDEAIHAFEKQLNEKGYECSRLRVPRAGHSKMMEPILEELENKVSQIKLNPPKIPYISGVTGKWITVEQATDPHYWARHSRKTVRFYDGLNQLFKEENSIFVQVGSDRSLSTLVELHPDKKPGNLVINLLRHPKDKVSDVKFLLHKIGLLWLYGKEPDWEAFYPGQTRYRVPLPTYSFDNLEYMTGGNPFKIAFDKLQGQSWLSKEKEMADWFYTPTWTRSRLPVEIGELKELSEKDHWLLFMDDCGVGLKMKDLLEQRGHRAASVKAGAGFHQEGNSTFTINPASETDYVTLVKELSRDNESRIRRIVHLWGVGDEKEDAGAEKAFELGLLSLTYLAKALGSQGVNQNLEIQVVTTHMQEVGGEARLCPEKSTVLGAVRVIPLEFPHIRCRSVDMILPPPGSPEYLTLIRQLLSEFSQETAVNVVAYRQNERWEQTLAALRLEETAEELASLPLKENGVYLVVGGLGGIGLELAAYLASKVKARLILTRRSPFPPRKEWQQWLDTHEKDDQTGKKIRRLEELEKMGSQILTASVDLSQPRQVQELLAQSKTHFKPLNGVILSAGVPGGGSIQLKTRELLEQALAPKVKGTLVLDSFLRDIPLDFFVICSSGNSFLPMFGQVDYCASNSFLDAYANYNTSIRGKFTRSINWNRWINTGMAVKVEQKHKENTGFELSGGMTPRQGLEVFHRILQTRLPQVIVDERDIRIGFELRKRVFRTEQEPGTAKDQEKTTGKEAPSPSRTLRRPRPDLKTPYAAPGNEKEKKLAELMQNFFGYEKVGIHDDFFELGGDSLKALTIIGQIKRELDPKISLSDLLLHPTIKELLENKKEESIFDTLSCVVKLNKGGNKKNMFIIHPRHGMVYPYKELARQLENDVNVFGIQAKGMEKNCPLPLDMETMIEEYLQEIRTVQKNGPYIIVGYCFGSMIGYNLVKRLEDLGCTVALYIMLDELQFIPNPVARYYRQKRLIDLMLKPLAPVLTRMHKRKKAARENTGANPSPEQEILPEDPKLRAKLNVERMNKRYWEGSIYKRINGIIKSPLLLIRAKETHLPVSKRGFARATYGKSTFAETEGNHDTIFESPYVEKLADIIRTALQASDAPK